MKLMKEKRVGVGFGVFMKKDNMVLLGKRHEDPEKADSELHGEGTWTMPGGKFEFQETFAEGVSREVFEETGIAIDTSSLQLVSVSNDIVEDAHFVTLGFLATSFEGGPEVKEPDEITEWKWFDLDNLPEPIFPPSKKVLSIYKQNKLVTDI